MEMLGTNLYNFYICVVIFFIVLDLRLTKGWSKALLLFLCLNISLNYYFVYSTGHGPDDSLHFQFKQ